MFNQCSHKAIDDIFYYTQLTKLQDSPSKTISLESLYQDYNINQNQEDKDDMFYKNAWKKVIEENNHLHTNKNYLDEAKLSSMLEKLRDKLYVVTDSKKHVAEYVDSIIIPKPLAYSRLTTDYTTAVMSFRIMSKVLTQYQTVFYPKQEFLLDTYTSLLETLSINATNMSVRETLAKLNEIHTSYHEGRTYVFGYDSVFDIGYTLPGCHYFTSKPEKIFQDYPLYTSNEIKPHPNKDQIESSLRIASITTRYIEDLPHMSDVLTVCGDNRFMNVKEVFRKICSLLDSRISEHFNEAYVTEIEELRFFLFKACLSILGSISEYQNQLIQLLSGLEELLDNIDEGIES